MGPGFRGLWGQEGKILLLIDGKEMNEQLYSTIQLGHEFPVELIERIEVVRGPGSVIYGGNAELAVINVITRGVQGSTDALSRATYGQLGTTYGHGAALTLSGRKVFESVPGLSAFASASLGQGQRSDAVYRGLRRRLGEHDRQLRHEPHRRPGGRGLPRPPARASSTTGYYTTSIDGRRDVLRRARRTRTSSPSTRSSSTPSARPTGSKSPRG